MTLEFYYVMTVTELDRPIGKLQFGATVSHIEKYIDKQLQATAPPFHEFLGATEEEARSKARAKADEWIAQQQGKR